MATVIRQKLGSSKTRLMNKVKEIQNVLKVEKDVSLYDAARYSLEIGKKIDTFQGHIRELEETCKGDEAEENRFIGEYSALEEILNNAEELQTKLDFIAKHQDDRERKRVSIEEKGMENELELT